MAGLGNGSPPETYDLAAPAIAKSRHRAPVHIAVTQPNAVRMLDSEQILVKAPGGRLSYFPGAAWGDRLPRLFQSRLVEALEDSGRFQGVSTQQQRVSADYSLLIEIRDFQIEVDNGAAAALVDVFVKLVDERQGQVAASRQFTGRAPAAKDNVSSGVAAFNEAFQQVASQIVQWTANPRGAARPS